MTASRQLTLYAELDDILRIEASLPAGYELRATRAGDQAALARLYFAAYSQSFAMDSSEAADELRVTYEGEYGPLDLEASPVVLNEGAIAASVMTVEDTLWPDTPAGPFIIEVMVDPAHRRRGLAECLLIAAAERLAARGEERVGLRVMADNTGALQLYRKLGFVEAPPEEERAGG